MKVQEVMSKNPAFALPQTKLQELAKLMCDHDCGAIPVVENGANKKLLGIVTDRDIVCRVLAGGKNLAEATAQDCLSQPVVSVLANASLDTCAELMERHQIRRIPVLDERGACCGIVSLADLAKGASTRELGRVLRSLSEPAASTMAA